MFNTNRVVNGNPYSEENSGFITVVLSIYLAAFSKRVERSCADYHFVRVFSFASVTWRWPFIFQNHVGNHFLFEIIQNIAFCYIFFTVRVSLGRKSAHRLFETLIPFKSSILLNKNLYNLINVCFYNNSVHYLELYV